MFRRICMAAAALALGAGAASAQSLNPGYKLVLEPGELTVTHRGKTVFEVSQDPGDPLFVMRGVRDMTGNGHANFTVIWRRARSAAHFVMAEMRSDGFVILHEEQGMTSDILSTYEHLTDDQAAALARGESLTFGRDRRRPLEEDAPETIAVPDTAAAPEPAPSPGHWAFIPGSWDLATAAELGWRAQSDDGETYSQIRFRCPDNGDDIWVLVDRTHDSAEAVPRQVALVADGMEIPLRLMPQINDQTGDWYPIGMVGRQTDLFERLEEAGSVEMLYGDERVVLIANGPEPEDKAALSLFRARCGLTVDE